MQVCTGCPGGDSGLEHPPDERFTTIGRAITASTELIAVSVTSSATFPPNRWLNRLAVGPPGDAATSSIPTAGSGGSPKASTRPKQIAGSSTIWHSNATTAAFGYWPTRRKSSRVRLRPRPSMTMPMAKGRLAKISGEPMADILGHTDKSW